MTRPIIQRTTLALFIIIVLAWYWYVRSQAPAATSVNGIYANVCCSDITLRDGLIVAGATRVPFKLANMKFGLTAYPAKWLEVNGNQLVVWHKAEGEALPFDEGGRALTVCGDRLCNKTYIFTRR